MLTFIFGQKQFKHYLLKNIIGKTYLFTKKVLQKHTYTYNLLQVPAEMNTIDS